MKKYVVILILAVAVVSCGKQQSQTEKDFNNAKQEVLDVHDELMKEMGTIGELIQKVKSKMDTTDTSHSYENALAQLKHAHAFMFSWMHNFHKDFPDINNTEKSYTEKEFKQRLERIKGHQNVIAKLEKEVENSIADAQVLLKKTANNTTGETERKKK